MLRADSRNFLNSGRVPRSRIGWSARVAVLAVICCKENLYHSSKVITPVFFLSIDSNILSLACSFSSSVLYSSSSFGAKPYRRGTVAAISISLEKWALLTRPSLLVSASTNILRRALYNSACSLEFLLATAFLMNQMKSGLLLLKPVLAALDLVAGISFL